jgi:Domain of unknown function (DUF1814).
VLATFEAVAELNKAGVKYVVVGGVATVIHGHPRHTDDIDFIVALDRQNALAAVQAIMLAGFAPNIPIDPEDFADEVIRQAWIKEKNMLVLGFRHKTDPFQHIDLFVSYPIDFDKMYRDSEVKEAYGTPVRVCSIDDLIRLKLLAGRPKDLEDVRILEMIRESEA